jgi:hypothetical protein
VNNAARWQSVSDQLTREEIARIFPMYRIELESSTRPVRHRPFRRERLTPRSVVAAKRRRKAQT